MEAHFNYPWYAHAGDPNWDYYVPRYVCQCDKPKILYSDAYDRWSVQNLRVTDGTEPIGTEGLSIQFAMSCGNDNCDKALRAQLRHCARCGSAWYNLFLHPKQLPHVEQQQCWHCLEDKDNYLPVSKLFGRYLKCAPPEWAIAPRVEPKSMETMIAESQVSIDALTALLGL